MNLFDSSFLCLDIGTSGVRGIAHRVRSAKIDKSAIYTVDSFDTVFALKSVIDELEKQIGSHFDSAYITGNFGQSVFNMVAKSTVWSGEHKITASDIKNQISGIAAPEGFYSMHIIPLRYDTPSARNMTTPVGYIDRQLISAFGVIFYETKRLEEINTFLRRAHIQSECFYAPHFLQNAVFHKPKHNTLFIDLGAQFTTASLWTDRGPVWHKKIAFGGTNLTMEISEKLKIDFDDAEKIKRDVASLTPKEMDRFTPASTSYEFSRSDINEIILPNILNIIEQIKMFSSPAVIKYKPVQLVLTGGGSEIEGIKEFFENAFGLPVQILNADATVRALSAHIWNEERNHREAYLARQNKASHISDKIASLFKKKPKKRHQFIPILPSTLCFDMKSPETYSLFKAGGISMIHVDIMDGFYVSNIAGSIEELKYIRTHTDCHLHVHLMTEGPEAWAKDAIASGADTIILSTNTSGVRAALRLIKSAGRRAGIAINPETSVSILKPILRELDEVMIMTVTPGAAGQTFNENCLHKITVLNATRKKYGLKYTISVDGGINAETAKKCWEAGADLLVSGSYLAKSSDFPLSVQSLLKN